MTILRVKMKEKHLIAVKIKGKTEIFEFPSIENREEFIQDIKNYDDVDYAINKINRRKKHGRHRLVGNR